MCRIGCTLGQMGADDAVQLLCGADMTCQSGTTGYTCGETYVSDNTHGRQSVRKMAGRVYTSSSQGPILRMIVVL